MTPGFIDLEGKKGNREGKKGEKKRQDGQGRPRPFEVQYYDEKLSNKRPYYDLNQSK